MFREVRTREKVTDRFEVKESSVDITKRIKPETDITVEDAMAFWNMEIERVSREANQTAIDITKRV